MKKKLVLAIIALVVSAAAFAQEYTFYYSGITQGIVTITKDTRGKITIRFNLAGDGNMAMARTIMKLTRDLPRDICPLLPKGFDIIGIYTEIVIDGNTTTYTSPSGWEMKIVIEGNTTTETYSSGWWRKTVVEGNTTTRTDSDGSWAKIVIEGNTTIKTSSDGHWEKTVVNGNTTTTTDSEGEWRKTVVNGNTTTTTGSYGYVHTITTAGNRKTETWADDKGRVFETEVTVINGNTTTRTTTRQYSWETSSAYEQVVIDKQGTSIFITVTGRDLHVEAGGEGYFLGL